MSESAPNNAVLANAVDPKDLSKQKKHLDHVDIKSSSTLVGGVPSSSVHLGPGKGQADFPPHTTHTHSAVGAVSTGGNNVIESSRSGEVSVQSSVTIDTTQAVQPQAAAQIQALLSKLSTTTSQAEEYSRQMTEKISTEANRQIQKIIAQTQLAQDALLKDASSRSLEIETEYSHKLKEFLQGLDASKASNLASLEKDLNLQMERLLVGAREDIDEVHRHATQQKIGVMQNASLTAIHDVDRLTDQVKQLGEAEVERLLESTTTTVITTQTTTDAKSKSPPTSSVLDKSHVTHMEKRTEVKMAGIEPRTAAITKI